MKSRDRDIPRRVWAEAYEETGSDVSGHTSLLLVYSNAVLCIFLCEWGFLLPVSNFIETVSHYEKVFLYFYTV